MTLQLDKGAGAKLLSLDGGGVKGISTLTILKAIMDKVQEKEDGNDKRLTEERLPVNYFHLAAGTSTGGLIALMLFRLNMSITEATKTYKQLSSQVFSKPRGWFESSTRHDGNALKKAIDKIVGDYGVGDDKNQKGKVNLVNNKAKM
jgi:patatin-like phospholipase/acyl hydrolase